MTVCGAEKKYLQIRWICCIVKCNFLTHKLIALFIMKKILAVILSVSCAFMLCAAEKSVKGKVSKTPPQCRVARNRLTALLQLDKDYEVTITGVSKQWLAIKPPENSRVWVLKSTSATASLQVQ